MKKLILFITGILVLGISFSVVLVGCGIGSRQQSIAERGNYAVDFSNAPGVVGFIAIGESIPDESISSLKDTPLTIEAWVKTKQHKVNKALVPIETLYPFGGIFSRGSDAEGIMLWIDRESPDDLNNPTGLWRSRAAFTLRPFNADPYTIWSSTVLNEPNTWYHIAAVLVNENHSGDTNHVNACGAAAAAETPHVDLYMNGVFDNCGSVDGNFTYDLDFIRKGMKTNGEPRCKGDEDIDYINVDADNDGIDDFCYPFDENGNKFKFGGAIGYFQSSWLRDRDIYNYPSSARNFTGIIDEVRFWSKARTQTDIQADMKKEIDPQDSLIGYWRLNEGRPDEEGTGNIILDSSGWGKGGVKFYCDKWGELAISEVTGKAYTAAGAGCAGPTANVIPWHDGWVDLEKDLAGETGEDWRD